MRVDSTTFTKLMNRNHQMIIPIYQRVYSWKKEQCLRLWEDITAAATNPFRKNHYTGTIYYIDDENRGTGIDISKYLLIDGQQRTTTLSLFLIALCTFIDNSRDKITKSKIYSYFLLNREEEGMDKYKLIPSTKDRATYLALLNGEDLPTNPSARILKNYNFFMQWINSSELSVDEIYEGVKKLTIINSRLERGIDDPQLIFEGLNSTGLKLTEAEKIKNYMFMSFSSSVQEELYNKYWHEMELLLNHDENSNLFDLFIRDYLTIKTGVVSKLDKLYETFGKYSLENRDEFHPTEHLKDWVKEMYLYAKSYAAIHYATEEDKILNQSITNINGLRSEVAYPLLLQVYYDYSIQKALSVKEVVTIFECVSSYIFRRSVCGIPTNSLIGTFASLIKDIDEYDYVNSIICTLVSKTKKQKFPRDEEFIQGLMMNNLYNNKNTLSHLFYRLENFNRKEYVPTSEYTIEHIMPQNQNLSDEWKSMLGEGWQDTHINYLHTLGNLTLTGYNSELSDRSFLDKQRIKGGFSDSPLRLNRSLSSLTTWNQEQIEKRAKELANMCLNIWAFPEVSEEKMQEYAPVTVTAGAGGVYDLSLHLAKMSANTRELFVALEEALLVLDPAIHRVVRKRYIAFKYVTNILDVRARLSKLDVVINVKIGDLEQISTTLPIRDIRKTRSAANGDIDLAFTNESQIPEIVELVKLAMARQNPSVFAR